MAYVPSHGHEMKQFVAYLDTDIGCGATVGLEC
jgi:hypothetical protein